jgi:hypothetical protein
MKLFLSLFFLSIFFVGCTPSDVQTNNGTPSTFAIAKEEIQNNLECGNLLSLYAQTHDFLDFVECEKNTEGDKDQTLFTAKYTVAGTNAQAVEAFLMQTYNHGKLQWLCCGWEAMQSGQFSIDSMADLESETDAVILGSISMYSPEMTEKDMQWSDTESFTVQVKIIMI